jgi:signal transduction histidine kinase
MHSFVVKNKKNKKMKTWVLLYILLNPLLWFSCKSKLEIHNPEYTKHRLEVAKQLKVINAIQYAHPDSALIMLENMYLKMKEVNDDSGYNDYYRHTSFIYAMYKKNYAEANKRANSHIEFAKNKNDLGCIADAYTVKGIVLSLQQITDSASYYMLKALEITEENGFNKKSETLYNNLIYSYQMQGDHESAIKIGKKGLQVAEAQNDSQSIAAYKVNLYVAIRKGGDTPTSNLMINDCYSLLPSIKNKRLKINILNNYGESLLEANQNDSALKIFDSTLALSIRVSDTLHIAQSILFKGDCHLKANRTKEAMEKFLEAEKIYNTVSLSTDQEKGFYQSKYKIFKQAGNLPIAIEALEKSKSLEDTLKKYITSKILAKTEREIQQTKFAKSLADKDLNIVKKNSAIGFLLFGILALVIITMLVLYNQKRKKQLHEKNILFLKKENEWVATNAALQAQLLERSRISREIHDELGASLTSITLSTELLRHKLNGEIEELDKISITSSSMVDALNEIIWSLNSGNDSVKSLIAYVRKMYFSFLEDSGMTHHFDAEALEVDIPLAGTKRRAIYLTIKEGLNNIVKHAKAKEVQLKVFVSEKRLIFHLKDDGIGLQNGNEFGNGLKNMRHNIENIAGSIEFTQNNGTQISIDYPL